MIIWKSRAKSLEESYNGWMLLHLACASIKPSENFFPALLNYLVMVIDNHPNLKIILLAKECCK